MATRVMRRLYARVVAVNSDSQTFILAAIYVFAKLPVSCAQADVVPVAKVGGLTPRPTAQSVDAQAAA